MSSNASLLTAGPTDVPDVADLDVPDLDCFNLGRFFAPDLDCSNLGRFFAPDLPDMMVYEAAAEYSYSPSSASSCCCSSILDTKYADRRHTYHRHELEGQTTRGE